ncbi:MAG: hypothetical protein J5I93_10085, partial [Pirellulaceae bacterium]|nr:hypothetical protein [Pirellulaceae bacterium]
AGVSPLFLCMTIQSRIAARLVSCFAMKQRAVARRWPETLSVVPVRRNSGLTPAARLAARLAAARPLV